MKRYILSICLLALPVFGIDSTYKHTQKFEQKTYTNMSYKAEVEMETDTDLDGSLDYIHYQLLLSYKTKYLDIEPGFRYIDKDQGYTSVPMIDLRNSIKAYGVPLKSRLRYAYEIPENKDAAYIIRYKLSSSGDLIYGFKLVPSCELFINDSTDIYRTRYGGAVERNMKRWVISLGYEYNDNEGKPNTQTYVTELGYKF